MGTGALICHPERHLQFRTLLEGGSGIHSLSMQMPETLPERLEAGTQNVYGFAGLAAALEELVFKKDQFRLAELLAEKLRKRGDIRLFGAGGKGQYLSEQYMPVLLLNKRGVDCEDLAESLAEKDIAVRGGYHCAPAAHRAIGSRESGGVRVSFGRSNTIEDIHRFLDAI
jgi:selenocysteine lyase/cysteine desulfurase